MLRDTHALFFVIGMGKKLFTEQILSPSTTPTTTTHTQNSVPMQTLGNIIGISTQTKIWKLDLAHSKWVAPKRHTRMCARPSVRLVERVSRRPAQLRPMPLASPLPRNLWQLKAHQPQSTKQLQREPSTPNLKLHKNLIPVHHQN